MVLRKEERPRLATLVHVLNFAILARHYFAGFHFRDFNKQMWKRALLNFAFQAFSTSLYFSNSQNFFKFPEKREQAQKLFKKVPFKNVIVISQQKIQNGTYHQNQLIVHLYISRHIYCIYFLLFLFFSLWFVFSLWVLKFRVFKCREDVYARVFNLVIFLTIAKKHEI